MIKTILYFFLSFGFLVICAGCTHEYFNPEEVKFWANWCLTDTVYYANDCNSDIDTMIIRETSISLPPTRNILVPNKYNFLADYDISKATIAFNLHHKDTTYYFTISMWADAPDRHRLTVFTDGSSPLSSYGEFPFNDPDSYVLRYDGKDIHVDKGKTPFDYFILHQDSTLSEYSINNTVYKKISSVRK